VADFGTFKEYFVERGHKTGYLATVAGRGRATVRPVTFFLVGLKLYFCTFAGEAKVKQIKKNPHVEVCIPVNRGRWRGYYRIVGVAEIVSDRDARRRVFRKVPYPTDKYWDGVDDPNLVIVQVKRDKNRYLPPGKAGEVDVKL
jgi:general stress protein 26